MNLRQAILLVWSENPEHSMRPTCHEQQNNFLTLVRRYNPKWKAETILRTRRKIWHKMDHNQL